MKNAKEAGIEVFNKKYDANHWNDLGAYYGTDAMLEELKKDIPTVHVNTEEDMEVTEVREESLLVSKFPIDEMVPVVSIYNELESRTDLFADELELNESYRGFGYYLNPERIEEGSPKALVFQGSYMNGYGYKYLQNAFGEYIYVHDYQNILNFPYYYNIFKPDCVIFEVAEYTFADSYFNLEKMKTLDFQSTYKSMLEDSEVSGEYFPLESVEVEEGKILTKINWSQNESLEQTWMFMGDEEYDLMRNETGYTVTVLTEEYQKYKDELKLAGLSNGMMLYWK